MVWLYMSIGLSVAAMCVSVFFAVQSSRAAKKARGVSRLRRI